MARTVDRLRGWVTDHRTAAAAFLIVTSLLVVQRLLGWNWDFMVYTMNGEYLLHGGSYVEWYRAPVAGLVMGLYRFVLPRTFASLLFVASVSLLFFHAAWRVAERYDVAFDPLYLLLVSPFVIMQGTFHGTEMLALAFGMLFVAELDRPRSGLWLALAFLTRYTFAFAVPLVLLQRDVLKSAKTYAVAALPVLAWAGFNWRVLGDPVTSIANSVALNVALRETVQAPDPLHLLQMTGLCSLVLALYLWRGRLPSLGALKKTRWSVLTAFAALILVSYLRTPIKPLRYLYPLAFPVAVAAAATWDRMELPRLALLVLAVAHLGGGAYLVATTPATDPAPYRAAAADAAGCQVSSNYWPHLSYAGAPAEPVPDINGVKQQIEEGYRVVIFPRNPHPPFIANRTLVRSLPVIEDGGSYLVLGREDRCLEPGRVNSTYFTFREQRLAAEGIEREYRPCRFLFGGLCGYLGL